MLKNKRTLIVLSLLLAAVIFFVVRHKSKDAIPATGGDSESAAVSDEAAPSNSENSAVAGSGPAAATPMTDASHLDEVIVAIPADAAAQASKCFGTEIKSTGNSAGTWVEDVNEAFHTSMVSENVMGSSESYKLEDGTLRVMNIEYKVTDDGSLGRVLDVKEFKDGVMTPVALTSDQSRNPTDTLIASFQGESAARTVLRKKYYFDNGYEMNVDMTDDKITTLELNSDSKTLTCGPKGCECKAAAQNYFSEE